MLTIQEVERAVPANLKSAVTQQLVDMVNNITTDQEIAEQVRNNFISYTSVLKDGKFRAEDYVNAVAYVSYKLMGYSNQDAYMRTFPQRYANLVAKGTASKDIAAYVVSYNKGKLVNAVMEQTLVPSWVLNQDLYQKALNVQADLMLNANSEKVRSDAANSLLTHLKKPEAKAEISIDLRDNSGMNEIKDALQQMASAQKAALASGTTTKEIAATPLIAKQTEEPVVIENPPQAEHVPAEPEKRRQLF